MTWSTARLVEPSPDGYLLAAVASNRRSPLAHPFSSASRSAVRILDELARECAARAGVLETARLEAVLGAPGDPRERSSTSAWDHALLVRTQSPAVADELASATGQQLTQRIGGRTLVLAARNIRRIADVPHPDRGVYLLNYFTGPDVASTVDVWQYTAGWFQDETGLTNSTALQPIGADGGYAIINHCHWRRWRQVLPQLVTKRSFRTFVLRRFAEVGVQAHPILYRLRPLR